MSSRPEDPERNDSEAGYAGIGETFEKVVVPTLITAVLVYFGAVRTNTTYRVFGVDPSVLGLSPQDYVFRSVDTVFEPVVWLLLAVMVLMPLHHLLVSMLSNRPAVARWVALGTALAGALLCVAGVLGEIDLVRHSRLLPVIPMSIGLGVLLLGYASRLNALTVRWRLWPQAESPLLRLVRRMAFVGLLFVLSLWSSATYIHTYGRDMAIDLVTDPRRLPGVVVYAPERLHIEGPGVVESSLPQSADKTSRYRYRYDGLRLLIHANNQYFLLPVCWTANGRARAIALPDDRSIRVEFFSIPDRRTMCG
ncbi:hypothetical protein [Streptosporangium sp. NPDC048865]|uniref:hypothetical protein n=1 Tax=Streptosporangium sp. NPDC048865 TaxID=3155766 RepID=UPI00342086A1